MSRLRLGRLTRSVLLSAAAVAALPVAVAVLPLAGAIAEAPVGVASATPHLDAVEQTLRTVSPGLEGSVWQRTNGNSLDPSSWLLQTPGCWGDAGCTNRTGTQHLLATLTDTIAKATSTVDISTLAPLPDGPFADAIVNGLRSAAAEHKIRVRILLGAVPVANLNVLPSAYRDELIGKLGPAAANVTLHIASMTTSKSSFSWNHSKIVVVDGRAAITGGTNFWNTDYIDTTHPVSDVSMALTGPAASSAGRYLDTLWTWTCQNTWNAAYVWFAASNGSRCQSTLGNPVAAATGDLPMLAVGSLGVGIKKVDSASTHKPTLPTAPDVKCSGGLNDNTNTNRDHDTVNPDESALRALVASATSHVEISQQDVSSLCPPLPRYDIRLYDILASKLVAGVKVRIVLSDPASRGTIGSGGYSQITALSEVSDIIRNRLAVITGDQATAKTKMCGNLQLASFRSAPTARWADGEPFRLHHKLVAADGAAFYIGSKNLYPAWLQDFGYMVESKAAAAQLKAGLLDPQWTYSKETATVDHERGICPA